MGRERGKPLVTLLLKCCLLKCVERLNMEFYADDLSSVWIRIMECKVTMIYFVLIYWNCQLIENVCQLYFCWEQCSLSSVTLSCLTLCDPMDCSTPGLPVHHQLPEFTQTHVHWVGDAIQPSHPLSSPSPPTFNLSQHQGLFKWVISSRHMAKVLEFQLQHQSFQWIFRTDFL